MSTRIATLTAARRQPTDWRPFVRLGLVLTPLAALAARLLVERVGEEPVIVGVIVVASLLAWRQVEPIDPPQDRRPGQPVRRHRTA